MARVSDVVVLAEDERHQRFAFHYLKRLGNFSSPRFIISPSGRGSAEQFVRERYANEVREFRRRSARASTALIVVIDSDRGDISTRIAQLQEVLVAAQLQPRVCTEKIAHLIPKRNIETWILCLDGQTVDEESDYSGDQDVDSRIRGAALTFFQWTRPNATIPQHCVPSLRTGVMEIRRLE